MPHLTIGLPVFNGAATLARSLDRLLAQTFDDFELIISDNASTDATPEICAAYVKRDRRISYYRNHKNTVWSENFHSVLMRARTPYFMWATHDDLWEPRFAAENLSVLERNDRAVCSVSKISYFAPGGKSVIANDTGPIHGAPADRVKRFLWIMEACGRLYGVYRTDILKQCFPADVNIYASDWLVVALTLLHGEHLEVPEVLLAREAQPALHYFKRFGQIDRFDPEWRDFIFPLRRFNEELRKRVPTDIWRHIRPALSYLNLRQTVLMCEYNFPAVSVVTKPLRWTVGGLIHKQLR